MYLSRQDVTVSDVVLNVLKISDNAEIKKVLQERGEALIKDNAVQNTIKNRG